MGLNLEEIEKTQKYKTELIKELKEKIPGSIIKKDKIEVEKMGFEISIENLTAGENYLHSVIFINHEKFIEPLKAVLTEAAPDTETAVKITAVKFTVGFYATLVKAFIGKDAKEFKKDNKKYKVYTGEMISIGERKGTENIDYWYVIEEEIRDRLGNKPFYWINLAAGKTSEGEIKAKCSLNGIESREMSELLCEEAEKWEIKSSLYADEQNFIIVADENNAESYPFTRKEVKEFAKKSVWLFADCEDGNYDKVFKEICEMCNYESIAVELFNFVPEITAAIIYSSLIKLGEYFYLIEDEGGEKEVYRDSITSFNWIWECIEEMLVDKIITKDELTGILKASSIIKDIEDKIIKEGKVIEKNEIALTYSGGKDYKIS